MAELSEIDKKKYDEATSALMALPEKMRAQYCKGVIMAVVEGVEKVRKIDGKIPQAKAVQRLQKELMEQRFDLIPVVMFTVKPEFRDFYMELLERFAGE